MLALTLWFMTCGDWRGGTWPKKRPTLKSGTHPNASSVLAWPSEGCRKSQWPLISPVDFTIWVPLEAWAVLWRPDLLAADHCCSAPTLHSARPACWNPGTGLMFRFHLCTRFTETGAQIPGISESSPKTQSLSLPAQGPSSLSHQWLSPPGN